MLFSVSNKNKICRGLSQIDHKINQKLLGGLQSMQKAKFLNEPAVQ